MMFQGRGVGVLEAFDRLSDGPEFSAADERLLQGFAASAAAAVATAQSVAAETLHRSVEAQEAERSRWARELHDETLQELAATKLLIASFVRRVEDGDAERDPALVQAGDAIERAIRGLRHMITDLRPAQLDEFGLPAALDALAERARVLMGVAVEVDVRLSDEEHGADERLPLPVETAVYRVAQEALTNALKHAGARQVQILAHEIDDRIELTVRDDGGGFDPASATGGFGLLGMRERVLLADGALTIDAEPGRGTVIVASIPSGRARGEAGSVSAHSA